MWKIWLKSDEISLFWILLLALKIWRKMWSTISFSSSGKTAQKGTDKWIGMSNLFLFCSYFPPLENVIWIELIGSTYGTSTLLLWFSSHFPQYQNQIYIQCHVSKSSCITFSWCGKIKKSGESVEKILDLVYLFLCFSPSFSWSGKKDCRLHFPSNFKCQ